MELIHVQTLENGYFFQDAHIVVEPVNELTAVFALPVPRFSLSCSHSAIISRSAVFHDMCLRRVSRINKFSLQPPYNINTNERFLQGLLISGSVMSERLKYGEQPKIFFSYSNYSYKKCYNCKIIFELSPFQLFHNILPFKDAGKSIGLSITCPPNKEKPKVMKGSKKTTRLFIHRLNYS